MISRAAILKAAEKIKARKGCDDADALRLAEKWAAEKNATAARARKARPYRVHHAAGGASQGHPFAALSLLFVFWLRRRGGSQERTHLPGKLRQLVTAV